MIIQGISGQRLQEAGSGMKRASDNGTSECILQRNSDNSGWTPAFFASIFHPPPRPASPDFTSRVGLCLLDPPNPPPPHVALKLNTRPKP